MGVVRFGVFRLKLSNKELRKHGVPIRLTGHAMSILLLLLERPGEIVTREEIQQRLWAADTFVDFDLGLNTAIKKLRAALGDSAENSRYVETVPRLGYRFIAPVSEEEEGKTAAVSVTATRPAAETVPVLGETVISDDAVQANAAQKLTSEAVAARSVEEGAGRWRVGRWVAAVAAAGLILAAVPKLLVFSSPLPTVSSVRPLTSNSRIEAYGHLQTDGARLFYLERRGHKWELMQLSTSGGEAQALPSPFENTKIFAVSPDASEMLVGPFARRESSLPLFLMPAVGGAPRRVGDVQATDATFTPDGQHVTYANADGIYEVQLDGMNTRRLVNLDGVKDYLDWSPDGRVLRFTRGEIAGNTTTDRSELWETDAAGATPHPVLPGWDERPMQCCGKWTRDGKYYAFISQNHGGAPNIWMLRAQREFPGRPATKPTALNSGPVHFTAILASRDGQSFFALGDNRRNEYAAYRPETGEYHTLIGGSSAAWLNFSTQGNWTISRRVDAALWKSRPDGEERLLLVPASMHPALPRISRDGEEVAFQGSADNSHVSRIYTIDAKGGQAQLTVSDATSAEAPEWSPERAMIVYAEPPTPDGTNSLYILNRKTGEKTKIPGSEGLYQTAWSPDGTRLAANSEQFNRIAVLEFATQRWTEIAKGKVFGPPVWAADSKSLYYQDILEEGEPIHQAGIDGRALGTVEACRALLSGSVMRCGFEGLSPEGAFLLQLTRGDHDVYALSVKLP